MWLDYISKYYLKKKNKQFKVSQKGQKKKKTKNQIPLTLYEFSKRKKKKSFLCIEINNLALSAIVLNNGGPRNFFLKHANVEIHISNTFALKKDVVISFYCK